MKKVFSITLVTIISLLILSCDRSSDTEQVLKDSLKQIEQTVKTEELKSAEFKSKLRPYPQKKSIQQQPADIRIGFLDFFTFGKCNLQVLIGERNSLLGKMMPVSQQLHWEHHFFTKMKDCREVLISEEAMDSAFVADLDSIISLKSLNLPKIYWNATFGSPEFQILFSLATGPLPPDISKTSSNRIFLALDYLKYLGKNLGKSTLAFDLNEMEQHYYFLQKERFAGSLLKSIEILSYYLDTVADAIDLQLASVDKFSGTQDMMNYQTVFLQNYRQSVQPYLSTIYQLGEQFLTKIDQLYKTQLTVSASPFDPYFQSQLSLENPQGLWQEFKKAVERHNQTWQRLIDSGGISLN